MYATVRQLFVKKSFQDENKRRVQDELLTSVRAIPGFIDFYLIYTDKESEISVALFKDKKGADQYNQIANKFIKPFAPKLELQTMSEGEVVVQAGVPAIA